MISTILGLAKSEGVLNWFVSHEQKEAEKGKSESVENGEDAMEVENGEKEAGGEAKA